jgi:hypothetical protein
MQCKVAQPFPSVPPASETVKTSKEQVKPNANAGMPEVIHIIAATIVLDINIVVIAPAVWPSYVVPEPISAVMEAVIATDKLGAHHVERVPAPKMIAVTGVRNVAIVVAGVPGALISVIAAVVTGGLSALPSRPSRALRF